MAMQPSHEAPVVPVAPEESAQAAGVHYVSDTQPGLRRQRAGRGFCYRGLDGRPIRDPAVLRRMTALAIPPAWTDVWICPRPDGHLQATGRDARGRKQYRYHPRWRAVRDATKYDRLMAFGSYNADRTKALRELGEQYAQMDLINLAEALRFYGPDHVARDIRAGTDLYLPTGGYAAAPGLGGTWTDLMMPYLMATSSTDFPKDKPENARSVLPPPLHREGERVQPDWLYRFLLNPTVIRPDDYMLLRMPKFNLSPDEARAVVNYFTAVARLSNPGAGVTAPFVEVPQKDAE